MSIRRRTLLATGPLLLMPLHLARGVDNSATGSFQEFTDRSRASIDKGTKWMLKTFNRDRGCGIDIGTHSDISCTAMVGLALLSQGNTHYEGPYSRQVRSAVKFILNAVRRREFVVDLNSQVRADLCGYADHHFAALFLSQVLGEGWDWKPARDALNRLVGEISRAQTSQGGWGRGRYPRLAAVTGWCSLRGAFLAGINVRASAKKTAKYLTEFMKAGGQGNGVGLFTTAAGIRVLNSMGLEQTDVGRQAFQDAMNSVTKQYVNFSRLGGEQYLAFHLINEVMLHRGDEMWRKWFGIVREKTVDVQNRDGSWTGYSCITSRTFCTACALLVLSSPNRYLPISDR